VSAALATWELLASRDGDDSWAAGFGADLLGGILAGLIGSAIVLAAGWWWRRRRNRADFGCLAGTYNVTEKQPSQKPEGTVTINSLAMGRPLVSRCARVQLATSQRGDERGSRGGVRHRRRS
jgi:hypothetical protein